MRWPLGVGVALFPIAFSWFTLRSGYSTLARVISLGWLGIFLLFVFIGEKPEVKAVREARQQSEVKKAASAEAAKKEELRNSCSFKLMSRSRKWIWLC